MSQYLIIKQKIDEEFYPVVSYSRNTVMYDICDCSVPYGKGRPFTQDIIESACNQLQLSEKHITDRVRAIGKQIDRISSFNNSAEEKFELISELTAETNDLGEQLIDIEHARANLGLFSAMIDEARYNDGGEYYIGIEWDNETTD